MFVIAFQHTGDLAVTLRDGEVGKVYHFPFLKRDATSTCGYSFRILLNTRTSRAMEKIRDQMSRLSKQMKRF